MSVWRVPGVDQSRLLSVFFAFVCGLARKAAYPALQIIVLLRHSVPDSLYTCLPPSHPPLFVCLQERIETNLDSFKLSA
jgi:hypothetical protein